jgi:hypothetical protein
MQMMMIPDFNIQEAGKRHRKSAQCQQTSVEKKPGIQVLAAEPEIFLYQHHK